MAYNKRVVQHEHYFSPLSSEDDDTGQGRFDAIEDEDGNYIVYYPYTDCAIFRGNSFKQACDFAKFLSQRWKPEWDMSHEPNKP